MNIFITLGVEGVFFYALFRGPKEMINTWMLLSCGIYYYWSIQKVRIFPYACTLPTQLTAFESFSRV